MANVLVQDSSLQAIANTIRGKNGESTLYKPAEMAAAISALPTGTMDFITNDSLYGSSFWEQSGSRPNRGFVLPDSVAFEDIKFILGIGGINNSSVSVSTARHHVYLYCPSIYNRTIQDAEGNTYHACLGTYQISRSSNYYQGIDYGRGYRGYVGGTTDNHSFGWISYNAADHSVYFYTTPIHSSEEGPFEIAQGYAIAEDGRVSAIYSLGSGQ